MDIQNKAVKAALRMISDKQPEIGQFYKLHRRLAHVGRLQSLRPTFQAADFRVICRDSAVPVRMHYPKEGWENRPVILFFHGGGWVTGGLDSYNRVCSTLAGQTRCRVLAVDYRLAPEHPFPAALDDCYEISRYVFRNTAFLFDIPPEQIILMGDSAGGNLAAAVSLKARDGGEFAPQRQILLYPVVYNDYTITSPFESVRENGSDYILTPARIQEYIEMYAGDGDREDPYFAPILAKDFSNQPKTLVITAEFDPLRDEGELYADRLQEAGARVTKYRMKNALHGFFSLSARRKPVKRAYRLIRDFLEEDEGEN